jgi:N-acetylneuraminic acid mutarotase
MPDQRRYLLRTSKNTHPRRWAARSSVVLAIVALAMAGWQAPSGAVPHRPSAPGGDAAARDHNRHELMLPPNQLSRFRPNLDQASTAEPLAAQSTGAWLGIPAFPTPIQDNVVGYDQGTVYSVSGWNGRAETADMYSLTPGASTWTKLTAAPTVRADASGAFIDGKLYVTGGWNSDDRPTGRVDIYDPGTDTWTTGAPSPKPVAAAATAELSGKLYVVGGCAAAQCGATSSVEVYSPQSDRWSRVARYPEAVAFAACGAVAGRIYCAGGSNELTSLDDAYVYNPSRNKWSRIASLPIDTYGAGYTAADGQFLVQDGITDHSAALTDKGWSYSPVTGQWTALPTAPVAELRGGASLGFYLIGGDAGGGPASSLTTAEVLPGFTTP